jgi:hypothetical protein
MTVREKLSQDDAEQQRGTELFQKFRRFQLTQQMRNDDPAHNDVAARFRKGDTKGLVEYLRNHILKATDAEEFEHARIIAPGNAEVDRLNLDMLHRFARSNGDRVISWRLADPMLTGRGVSLNTITLNAKSEQLLHTLNPDLTMHFCAGAPVIFTDNAAGANPLRGIANGVGGWLYGLQWSTEELRSEAMHFLDTHPGDVLLPPALEPSAVLIRANVSKSMRESWPRELTLVKDDVVIPVGVKMTYIDIHKPRQTHTVTVDGRRASQKLRACVQKPMYDLAFAGTIHKSQGSGHSRCIVSLLRRPTFPARSDFHALYVALTRVKSGKGFRVLADPTDLDFVKEFAPDPKLLAFMNCYDEYGYYRKHLEVAQRQRLSSAATTSASSSKRSHVSSSSGRGRGQKLHLSRGRGRGAWRGRGRGDYLRQVLPQGIGSDTRAASAAAPPIPTRATNPAFESAAMRHVPTGNSVTVSTSSTFCENAVPTYVRIRHFYTKTFPFACRYRIQLAAVQPHHRQLKLAPRRHHRRCARRLLQSLYLSRMLLLYSTRQHPRLQQLLTFRL